MGNYRFIEGTVTSPMGFTAAGICASIKPSNKTKRDLALIYCDTPCTAAAVYTKNLVKSSAIEVTKKHLENGIAQAVIVNSAMQTPATQTDMTLQIICALSQAKLSV